MTTAKDPVAEAAHLLDALGWPEVRRPLLAEIERLRAIEAAARAFAEIEEAYSPSDLDRWATAFDALRTALEKGGAK
jgi:uncharacterized membrane protein